MEALRVSLIQSAIEWEAPAANLAHYAAQIAKLPATDLIVLPEMFTTGFIMEPAKHAETSTGPALRWMHQQAKATSAAITGSLVIEQGGHFFNRLYFVQPDGTEAQYDKRHPFSMSGEHLHYRAGRERLIVHYRGWRICPLICYDLRFPVWSRNEAAYDLLIYVANWPDRRSYDWQTLLKARAVENQCYVVGVNRVGEDANGHHYRGNSCVIDPGWRKTLYDADTTPSLHTATLSGTHLLEVRKKLPFLQDQDQFKIL